jgi:spoIIIJ-associated protein
MEEYEGGRRRGHGQRRRAGRTVDEKRVPTSSGAGEERRPPPPRRTGPPREPVAHVEPSPEPEEAKPARALLEEILAKMGLDDVEIVYLKRSEGEYFEVRGALLASLIGREGKTLEALNLIYNNIINAGQRNNRHYYTIDAEGYRARRADQLKTLALATLERVVREAKPIKLEPMLPSERKIVHLALADSPFVRTESEGVEPERRLVVFPKSE